MAEPSISFPAAKDIYPLGTVLPEVGEWRSLGSVVEKVVDAGMPDVSLADLAKIKPFLLDDGLKGGFGTLRFRMSDVYTSVTRMMLSGELPEQRLATKEAPETFNPNALDIAVRELYRYLI